MASKTKLKSLNINFNFSDDSDDDKDNILSNVRSKYILKEMKTESSSTKDLAGYFHLAIDKTIVAGDQLNRCDLSSLSEELGPPVTESTWLYSCSTDPTLYLSALEDGVSQDKLDHNIATNNMQCQSSSDKNTSRHLIAAKAKEKDQLGKENVCFKAKTTMNSKSSLKSATYHHQNDFARHGIYETPLRENRLFTKHRLYGGDACFISSSAEFEEGRIKSIPSLHEKVPVPHSQLETSFINPIDEKTPHDSESFVEVQDISIQTSLIVEDLHESLEEYGSKFKSIALNGEDFIDRCSAVLKSPHRSYTSKESEQSSGFNASCVSTDVTHSDTLPLELSSYEVEDVSVQTSFVDVFVSDCEPSLVDKACHLSSHIYERTQEQHVQLLEKSLVKLTLLDGENRCSDKIDAYNLTGVSAKELYITACDNFSEACNEDTVSTSSRYRKVNEEKVYFCNKQGSTISYNYQTKISENPKSKSGFSDQKFETCFDRKVNAASKQRKVSQNHFEDADLSPNTSDVEGRCDVLVAASDCEDNGNMDKRRNVYGKGVIDTIDESYIDTDDEDDDVADCKRITSGQNAKNVTVKTGNNKLKTATTSIPRRQNMDSSDGDSDFENFLSKVKSSSKPQEPSQEEKPLSEFIVDDEDNSSEDEDDVDDMFYIKTNRKLSSERRFCSRYRETVHTQYHSDDSSSEISDSDLDDIIADLPQRKPDDQAKSVTHKLDLSSDDDLLLETISSNKDKAKTSLQWQCSKVDSSETSSDTEVDLNPGIRVAPKTPGKNTGDLAVKVPCEGIDDFTSRGPDKAQFKTPRYAGQWERPFETPARLHVTNDEFRMPKRGSRQQPTTAPRPTFGGAGPDDDLFFLKSLTSEMADYKRHVDAARFLRRFKETKGSLAQRLFKIFNHAVFEEKLPKDFEIEWSSRYTKTAGTFYCKGTLNNFIAKVTLSVKICDSPERVRDTLAHELCHAAVKLINGVNEGHGRFWKSWAWKTNKTFPFLPMIARCHDYIITTKYTYQCAKCKYRVGRHSKSLDTDTKVCGHCKGNFELYLTSELNSSNENCKTPAAPKTQRTPNKFALFVKDCYSEVRKRDGGLRHGDVMKILSQQFAEKNKIGD